MFDAPDREDPDHEEFEHLLWLRYEQRIDVDAEIDALLARRHQRDEAARRVGGIGETEDVAWQVIAGNTEDPYTPEATASRFEAAHDVMLSVDTLTGRKTGGRLDHNRPPGAPPWWTPGAA